MRQLPPLALAATLLCALASTAHAQAPEPERRIADFLSERGRALVGGSSAGYYRHAADEHAAGTWFVNVSPSFAYFVRDGFGIGGSVGVLLFDQADGFSTTLLIGPDLYYDLVLGEQVSFLFTFGAHVGRVSTKLDGESVGAGLVQLSLGAPLMYHPSRSVAFGIGPRWDVNTDFGADRLQVTSYWQIGLASTIVATF